jgi:hypothetical protein
MDEATDKGMSPERLAYKILAAIECGDEEVYIGGKEVLGVYLKRLFPGYFSRLIRKARVR